MSAEKEPNRCLKCRREIDEGQVFCKDCLAEMEKQPVKPGTPVNLPKRPPSEPRAPKHAVIRPEDQVTKLEERIVRLHRSIAMLAIALAVVSGFLGLMLYLHPGIPDIGQNYTPMVTTAPAEPTAGADTAN